MNRFNELLPYGFYTDLEKESTCFISVDKRKWAGMGWVSAALNLRREASGTKRVGCSINPAARVEGGASLGQLSLCQGGKGTGLVKQFLICALLNKVTFIKHVNSISVDDGAKTMGNNNAGKL